MWEATIISWRNDKSVKPNLERRRLNSGKRIDLVINSSSWAFVGK